MLKMSSRALAVALLLPRAGPAMAVPAESAPTGARVHLDDGALASVHPAPVGPEIGVNFRITDLGGTGDPLFDALLARVAYNATDDEYLVVWTGDDNEGGLANDEIEVFGQRLDAETGAEIGANDFRISDMGGTGDPAFDVAFAAVAYNGADHEYLVVWCGNDNVDGMVLFEFEVFGQRLDATTGAEVGANDFRISDMGGTGDPAYGLCLFPAVAYNERENEYLVVWNTDDNVGGLVDDEIEMFGQRLDGATGSELGANDFRISDMGGTGNPGFGVGIATGAVAYNAGTNEYLVVWAADDNEGGLVDNEFEAFGQRLDGGTGLEIGANDFRISDMGGTGDATYGGGRGWAAYNPAANEYLVVWIGDDNEGGLGDEELEVFGQRLDAATGEEVGANDFRVSDMGGTGEPSFDAVGTPTVFYIPADDEYVVAWSGDDNEDGLVDEEFEVFGQRLDAVTGAEKGPNDFRISTMGGTGDAAYDTGSPGLALDPADNEYLVAWSGDDNEDGVVDDEFEIFGQRYSGARIFTDGFESGDTSAWSTTVP